MSTASQAVSGDAEHGDAYVGGGSSDGAGGSQESSEAAHEQASAHGSHEHAEAESASGGPASGPDETPAEPERHSAPEPDDAAWTGNADEGTAQTEDAVKAAAKGTVPLPVNEEPETPSREADAMAGANADGFMCSPDAAGPHEPAANGSDGSAALASIAVSDAALMPLAHVDKSEHNQGGEHAEGDASLHGPDKGGARSESAAAGGSDTRDGLPAAHSGQLDAQPLQEAAMVKPPPPPHEEDAFQSLLDQLLPQPPAIGGHAVAAVLAAPNSEHAGASRSSVQHAGRAATPGKDNENHAAQLGSAGSVDSEVESAWTAVHARHHSAGSSGTKDCPMPPEASTPDPAEMLRASALCPITKVRFCPQRPPSAMI